MKPTYLHVFLLGTVVLAGAGYGAYLNERRAVRVEAVSRLNRAVQLRVSELSNWRRERLGDGHIIGHGPGRELAARFLGTPTEANGQLVTAWFRAYSHYNQYDEVQLLDARGRVRLSVPPADGRTSQVVQAAAAEAVVEGHERLVDFFRDDRDQKMRLAVLVPISATPEGPVVGVVVLRIDPDRNVNVFVTTSPLLSRTAETALVRRRDDGVERLAPLRSDRDAVPGRTPVSAESRIEVKAATGVHGAVEGINASGRRALGWAAAVPDSPWHLLVSRDVEEIDELVVVNLRGVFLAIAALMTVNGLVLFVGWRNQHARHLERESASAVELKREVTRLRMALRSGQHGLWELDLLSGRLLVSASSNADLNLVSVPDGADLPVSMEHVHPEDRERALEMLERMRGGELEGCGAEVRMMGKDGSWRWIRLQGTVSEVGEDGRPQRAIGLLTDVTALKLAQLRSRRYAQLYAALSHSNDAIARCQNAAELYARICEAGVTHGGMGLAWIGLVDEATGRVDVAAAAGAVDYLKAIRISVDASDIHGQGPTGTAIRENRPIWVDDFVTNPITGPWHGRGAEHGWSASASLPIRKDGRPIGALMFYTRAIESFDEDDRKLLAELAANLELALDRLDHEARQNAAESRLQESEARYRIMFTGSSLPMLLIDPADGRIVDANLAAAEFYGWYRETLMTMRLADISTLPAETIRANMAEVLEQGLESLHVKHRLASGDVRDVEVFVGRIQTGEQARLLSTIIDVTERTAAVRAMESAMREKDALLKEVHHRVKNNLQVITSLLRLEGGRAADATVKRVMEDMQNRLISMALLHEMLYRTGTFVQVNLSAYLGQLANQLFRTLAPRSGVTLALDLSPVFVDMDTAVPCGLMVNELISNAVKHAFPAGQVGEVRVAVREGVAPGTVLLTVADTGIGFPEGFDPERGETLGLKLVASLARQLRGSIEFGRGPGATASLLFEPKARGALPVRS